MGEGGFGGFLLSHRWLCAEGVAGRMLFLSIDLGRLPLPSCWHFVSLEQSTFKVPQIIPALWQFVFKWNKSSLISDREGVVDSAF